MYRHHEIFFAVVSQFVLLIKLAFLRIRGEHEGNPVSTAWRPVGVEPSAGYLVSFQVMRQLIVFRFRGGVAVVEESQAVEGVRVIQPVSAE
jgi:hypothetical protein